MDTSNGKIVVLGENPAKAETPTADEIAIKEKNIKVLDDLVEKPEVEEPVKETKADEKPKPEDKKPEDIISKDKPKKEEIPPENEEGKPLVFSFENEKPTPKKEPAKAKETPLDLSDDVVRNYLESNHGLKIKHLSNLSEKEVLSEQVKAFKKFNEETNGTVADLYTIQRDWNKEPDTTLLESYYKRIDPNLSFEDVKEQIDLITVTDDDELNLDDRQLRQRKLDYSREIAKAKGYMNSYQEQYKVDLESGKTVQKPETAEAFNKRHEPYWRERDKSLKKMGDIKMNIKGLGDVIIPIEQADKDLVAKNTQTIDDFIARYQNKNGTMNAEKTVRGTLYSDEAFFKKSIQAVAEQVHSLTLENFSKENRNVDLDKVRQQKGIETNEDELVVIGRKNSQDFAPRSIF